MAIKSRDNLQKIEYLGQHFHELQCLRTARAVEADEEDSSTCQDFKHFQISTFLAFG